MEVLQEVATSQFVWAICCIAFVVWTTKTSKAREDKLMRHLERSNISQERTATALQSMEGRMDRMEKVIYSDIKKWE